MGQPYVSEIRMFAGTFAPNGWMFCEGQLISIADNDVLFNLVGTTYGGDGQNTFALPDLRGRLPLHSGNGFNIAQQGGVEAVTLTVNQMPAHSHPLAASTSAAGSNTPANNVIGQTGTALQIYREVNPATPMQSAIGNAGGNQPHENLQPFLCIDFIISLYGIYPSPT
jgi:microcystin-dependent protein